MSNADKTSNWADLKPRVISALAMALAGLFAIWMGGVAFNLLVAVATGLIVWEITGMLIAKSGAKAGSTALLTGTVSFLGIIIASFIPGYFAGAVPVGAAYLGALIMGAGGAGSELRRYLIYVLWVLIAGFGLIGLRTIGGLETILWLVAVVIATDTAGYFAGKTFGGPKFWVRVSPKKTWSGTIAGWIAAAIVGFLVGGPSLAILSAFLAFASQMGDAAESALKRYTGIKDSSNLIPGHGGVFDRFDALMGAAFVLILINLGAMFWTVPI